jgi:hypothetical protein
MKYGDPLIVKRNKNGDGGITVYGYKRILKNGIRDFEHRIIMDENFFNMKIFIIKMVID